MRRALSRAAKKDSTRAPVADESIEMALVRPQPSGKECTFGDEEIIVSKTDLRGNITYANEVFIRISGYTEAELLGQPHSLIRHPDMPRCVFWLLWKRLQARQEVFAYVKNMARNGDHYWVHAHVTPTFDSGGRITNYHSNRRVPSREAIQRIEPIYAALLAEERKYPGKSQQGMEAGQHLLEQTLAGAGLSYDEFVFALSPEEAIA